MSGKAWTVVRPDNDRSVRVLEDPDNGFGGFAAIDEPRAWHVNDGVTVPRQLYVARRSLQDV